ncbi:uncharacterized protein PHACADRAFT_32305 [Phanerochaete carnosa HHB-10118-sp]|uniref:Uncharacterized protein n=1 Tax=Phanerochaete carnosa (strain HHB-10118-sp) TaxID=650164 RepID=K5UNL5_PHACS|nr:uncharacterized protein PHACADRAFT_32305 [Phanerochaete carnosa HHB-10118-sp]EKM51326.1 hypothetical protein PHACADRAFT_32305 [Phanerochaete carnosa HHB-10118-sp]
MDSAKQETEKEADKDIEGAREEPEDNVDGKEADHDESKEEDDEFEDNEDEESKPEPDEPLVIAVGRKVKAMGTKRNVRRGNPSCFVGKPYKYLVQYKDEYNRIPKKGKGRNKRIGNFWHLIISGFWQCFDPSMFEDIAGSKDKEGIIKTINKSIKRFSRWRAWAATADTNNPWQPLLSQLRKPTGSKPRCTPGWLQFVSMEKERIFKEELTEEKRQHYEALADSILADKLEHYKAAQLGSPSSDSIEQTKACNRLASVLSPVLKMVSEYTRMEVLTLVGVRWVSEISNFEARAVNFGEIPGAFPKNFLQWDPDAFKKVFCGQITLFAKEVRKAKLQKEAGAEGSQAPVPVGPTSLHQTAAAGSSAQRSVHTFSLSPAAQASPACFSPSPLLDLEEEERRASIEDEPELTLPEGANIDLSVLKQLVYALEPGPRCADIESLNGLALTAPFKWAHEATIASNRQLIASLGLNNGLFSPPCDGVKRPRPKSRPKPKLKLTATTQPCRSSTRFSKNAAEASNAETSGEHLADQSSPDPLQNRSTTPRSSLVEPSSAHNDNDEPNEVLCLGPDHEHRVSENLQAVTDCMRAWVQLESLFSFQKAKVGLPCTSQPPEIQHWIWYARADHIVPTDTARYAAKFWQYHLVQGGQGDWSPLFKHSNNGFLTVLYAAIALCDSSESNDWSAALQNILWVLKQVIAAKQQQGMKRSAEGGGNSRDTATENADDTGKSAEEGRKRARHK